MKFSTQIWDKHHEFITSYFFSRKPVTVATISISCLIKKKKKKKGRWKLLKLALSYIFLDYQLKRSAIRAEVSGCFAPRYMNVIDVEYYVKLNHRFFIIVSGIGISLENLQTFKAFVDCKVRTGRGSFVHDASDYKCIFQCKHNIKLYRWGHFEQQFPLLSEFMYTFKFMFRHVFKTVTFDQFCRLLNSGALVRETHKQSLHT